MSDLLNRAMQRMAREDFDKAEKAFEIELKDMPLYKIGSDPETEALLTEKYRFLNEPTQKISETPHVGLPDTGTVTAIAPEGYDGDGSDL